MAKVKAIWGPVAEKYAGGRRMTWRFTVVFEEGTTRSYTLAFSLSTRRFRALAAGKDTQLAKYAEAMSQRDLLSHLPELKRAPLLEGRMTDLLRARLSDEQIAEATAAALRWSMR